MTSSLAHAVQATPNVVVRDASPADYPAIRRVLAGAYQEYVHLLPGAMFPRYFADLLDVERHARHGRVLVAEVDGRIGGSGAFYPDSSLQGFGWPTGWAGGRGLAVHPDARGHGLARALLAECERMAVENGAPVFAFHTAAFMKSAVALYEQRGYRRAPEFDIDLGAHYCVVAQPPLMAIAYRRDLVRAAAA